MSQSGDEERDAARSRARQELDAAGVPRWAQQGSPQQNEAGSGRYYVWVENGSMHGCLMIRPDSDEATAVNDLLTQCDHTLAQDESAWPPPTNDLTRPVATLIVRANGMGSGRLWRPETDLQPLQNLINHARTELADLVGCSTLRERSSAAEHQLPKLRTRVRFPSLALE